MRPAILPGVPDPIGGMTMGIRQANVRRDPGANHEPEPDEMRERVEELGTLLERICASQVKTCRLLEDSHDVPRSMKEVLSDRIRVHDRDLKAVRAFLAGFRKRKSPDGFGNRR
ncbi:MAG: hypothetical protein Kow00128_06790 [Deltaproteobacteria bacterium]